MQTPYYVVHRDMVDANYKKLQQALVTHWDNFLIGYSYKTNALPWVISHFDRLGSYAEVVSENEYQLAKKIGVDQSHIIYNGPIKTKETFLEAVINGCYVNIDASREIDWLDSIAEQCHNVDTRIGVRVNFDIESMCPGQSQCAEDGGRFGFCYENGELEKAIKRIEAKGFKVSGLHLHTSSKSRGLDIYRAIAETACMIKRDYDLDLDFVDVGGGFFGGVSTKPQFDEYMELMSGTLKKEFNPKTTTLIVEPGMAVIGAFVSYVTSVIDVKDTAFNRFVVTDGSRTNIDPLMTKSSYMYKIEGNEGRTKIAKQIIGGFTCMENDRLFMAKDIPELQPGDRIIYERVGAYTMCLTPLFIKYFPKVYVETNNALELVRHEWTPEQYIANCKIEE